MEAQDTIQSLKSACQREPSRDSVIKPCSRALCDQAARDTLQRTRHSRSRRSTSEGNDKTAPVLSKGMLQRSNMVLLTLSRWYFVETFSALAVGSTGPGCDPMRSRELLPGAPVLVSTSLNPGGVRLLPNDPPYSPDLGRWLRGCLFGS